MLMYHHAHSHERTEVKYREPKVADLLNYQYVEADTTIYSCRTTETTQFQCHI